MSTEVLRARRTGNPISRGITHGASGYGNYGCRCDPCRAGHAAEAKTARERRTWRLADDPTLAKHGLSSTYKNWGCRCRPCTDAEMAAQRARKAAA